MSHHDSIRELEADIERIKMMHRLGKVQYDDARAQIRALERRLDIHLDALPEYERQVYKIKKEFGKDF